MAYKLYGNMRFLPRSDTFENWEAQNPVLGAGEWGAVIGQTAAGDQLDTVQRIKVGDGVTPWNELPWWNGPQGEKGDDGVGVGKITDQGGEIFNDYKTNKAFNTASHTEGSNNTAACMGFKLLSLTATDTSLLFQIEGDATILTDSCIIDNRDSYGLENSISIQWGNNYDLYCNIKTDTVTYNEQTNITSGELDKYDVNLSLATSGWLWIPTNPEIGNVQLGDAAHAEGYNTKAVQTAGHSEGRNTIAAGKYAHTEGRDNIAVYAAHSEGDGTKALGHSSHSQNRNTIALGSYSHAGGVGSVAGTKAFTIQSINFDVVEDIVEEEPSGRVGTYYVATTGLQTNDGASESTPIDTIANAIALANMADYGLGDTVTIKLIGTVVDIGTLPSYDFDLIVESLNTKVTAQVDSSCIVANGENSRTVYKNVKIHNPQSYSYFYMSNSDVRFDSDCTLSGHTYQLVFGARITSEGSPTPAGQNVVIECPISNAISLSDAMHSTKICTEDVSLTVDNANASPRIFFNANFIGAANGYTTYSKNVNLNFKDIKAVTFAYVNQVTFGGALQIINSSACTLNMDTEGIADIEAPKWIITNRSACRNAITFTDEAGKFATKEGYVVTAYNHIGDAITSIDGILDLSEAAGEYTVDIIEVAPCEGTIVLDSVNELEVNDIISVKAISNQDFLLNAATISAIDDNTNTISVIGYPSQLNKFSTTGTDYLFILNKPMVGTKHLGDASNANGKNTKAIGTASHTDGEGTIAIGDHQFVYGKFNANKPNTVFEIGCGTSDTARSNALEVYKDGTVSVYGIKITRNSLRKLLESLN